MSPRERWFCRYCGGLTTNPDRVCRGHRDLLEAERFDGTGYAGIRSDPMPDERRPDLGADDTSAREGKGA
jgi:hypothetical protein